MLATKMFGMEKERTILSRILVATLLAAIAVGCTTAGSAPSSQEEVAWLQTVNGPWTRNQATLARLQAQNEGVVEFSVHATERTAIIRQLPRTSQTPTEINARFESLISPGVGMFRATVFWGGRAATYTYTCRLTDPRTMTCRMQIDNSGSWDSIFVRA